MRGDPRAPCSDQRHHLPSVSRRQFFFSTFLVLKYDTGSLRRLRKWAPIEVSAGGSRDATMAMQEAIDAAADQGRPLVLDHGVLEVQPGVLKLRSGVAIIGGDGATLRVVRGSSDETAILSGAHIANVLIQGVTFEAPHDRVWALDIASSSNIRVVNNVARGCALVRFSAGNPPIRNISKELAVSYPHMTRDKCCKQVRVAGNRVDGPLRPQGLGAICLAYTLGAEVVDNRIERHGHGIWWWGGDAGKIPGEGSKASPRWVQDLLVEGNYITQSGSAAPSTGCGVFGSKGEHIRVIRNTVSHCRDIEIDFEGCVDCEARENVVVSSASNSSLASFFFCSDIRFIGNQVLRTGGGRVFGIFNQSQQFGETGLCLLHGNSFESVGQIGVLGAISAVRSFEATENKLKNVRIEQSRFPVLRQEYRRNRLDFTIRSGRPLDGLYSQAGGFSADFPTRNIVAENVISSSIRQPAGSRAIIAEDADGNVDCRVEISGNRTSGFPIDICYVASAANPIAKTASIGDNVVENDIERTAINGSERLTRAILSGNHRDVRGTMMNYPSEVPTSGFWNCGQRILFDKADADGLIGAICTRAGTPGTWQKFKREPS